MLERNYPSQYKGSDFSCGVGGGGLGRRKMQKSDWHGTTQWTRCLRVSVCLGLRSHHHALPHGDVLWHNEYAVLPSLSFTVNAQIASLRAEVLLCEGKSILVCMQRPKAVFESETLSSPRAAHIEITVRYTGIGSYGSRLDQATRRQGLSEQLIVRSCLV